MPVLFIARHGETVWNAEGRLQGHTDVPLNEAGRAQALVLADSLRSMTISAVVTSDLSRAKETGALVADALAIGAPITVDRDLRERCFGIFEGLTREEIARDHEDAWRAWRERGHPPTGAEATDAIVERFHRAIVAVWARTARGDVLVVAHGGVTRAWLEARTGQRIEPIGNGEVYEVTVGARVYAAPFFP